MASGTADVLAAAVCYRYVPPGQPVAQAVTFIGDVLLHFTLSFEGSLALECRPGHDGQPASAVHDAGAVLHDLANGLFISAARVDHPRVESRAGHRFVHRCAHSPGPRTRRFTGACDVRLPCAAPDNGRPGSGKPASGGPGSGGTAVAHAATLGYVLDVTAAAASDSPCGNDAWLARYDDSLASIGAIVLEPLPITPAHAARLLAD